MENFQQNPENALDKSPKHKNAKKALTWSQVFLRLLCNKSITYFTYNFLGNYYYFLKENEN